MFAVKGIYQGGDTVKLDTISVQLSEPYEVVVAFLNPIPLRKKVETNDDEKRQQAFENFMSYRGILPSGFDYDKELSEYREERYGHTN